jgi:hypothetical protein
MNMLRGTEGRAGNLGSTIAGLSDASLLGGALSQADQIRANAANMREQGIQGRLGLGIQGLASLGGAADTARAQNIGGYGQMAGLAQNQGQINQNQLMQGFGQSLGIDQGPMNQANMIWQTLMGMPKSPSGLDVLGQLGSAALPFFFSSLGGGAGSDVILDSAPSIPSNPGFPNLNPYLPPTRPVRYRTLGPGF